jgi:hypothetical protein
LSRCRTGSHWCDILSRLDESQMSAVLTLWAGDLVNPVARGQHCVSPRMKNSAASEPFLAASEICSSRQSHEICGLPGCLCSVLVQQNKNSLPLPRGGLCGRGWSQLGAGHSGCGCAFWRGLGGGGGGGGGGAPRPWPLADPESRVTGHWQPLAAAGARIGHRAFAFF